MKKIYSIIETFIISIFSTYLLYSNSVINKLFKFFNITDDNEKKMIVGAVSVAVMALITMIIPWFFHLFLRRIKINTYYIQKDTVNTSLHFKKKAKKEPLCEKELVRAQLIITDGCSLFFKVARKLHGKLYIVYDPNLFETESKNGWDGSEDSLIERNHRGIIALDLFRGIDSIDSGTYVYKYDFYVIPRNSNVSTSTMKIRILSNNFLLTILLKMIVKVDTNKLSLECEV
ncbi:hypothetical protein [Carnobacterium mobile]|uniref:hypothetical protein n=1 Tax=Carnobacterium mobile TaxID=2750 RepID=UPI0018686159|nr:hypothetical protein [Carnobacterium mobile]